MLACISRVADIFDPNSLKIIIPKQMLQRLPIALAQVKVGNTSEKLHNKTKQLIYFFYQAKKLLKGI